MQILRWYDQIVMGSLLGSGYISRGNKPYLGISESRDKNWFFYKASMLEMLAAKTPISESRDVLKWRSKSDIVWQEYLEKFYRNGKKYVELETLDKLNQRALMIWFGDKGFWYSTRRLGLRTTAFGESNKIICTYLNEVGMSCSVVQDSYESERIVFDRNGTMAFIRCISEWLPRSMYYKLEHNVK